MGDDFKLQMAYLSADKEEYKRTSVWSQSKYNSRMLDLWVDQDTFFYELCLVKSCYKLLKFPVAHSNLNTGRCILSESKGRDFENFSRGSAPRNLLSFSR